MNYGNSKVVNFTTLRDMFLENTPTMHVHNPRKIKLKHDGVVVTEPEMQQYKFVFKNSRLMDNFDSSPYGYWVIYLFIHLSIISMNKDDLRIKFI